jgi:hypothetical protein
MKPRQAAGEPPGTTPPGGLLLGGGPPLSETIRFTLEPFTTLIQGCTYCTEPTTLLARRVSAAQLLHADPPPIVQPAAPFRYSLRREPACWVLVFEGKYAYLKHEIGLRYVNYLLHHPDQAVSGATLFSKFHPQSPEASGITQLVRPDAGEPRDLPDDAIPSEDNLDKDTERILAAHREKAQEFRETLRDPEALPSEKDFARQQLQQIIEFLATQKSTTQDASTRAGKRVRKSIQRLCENLTSQESGQPAPDPVAREFAAYVAQHILGPSRRYSVPKKGANVRVARGELAGQLTFECPSGHRWSAHL